MLYFRETPCIVSISLESLSFYRDAVRFGGYWYILCFYLESACLYFHFQKFWLKIYIQWLDFIFWTTCVHFLPCFAESARTSAGDNVRTFILCLSCNVKMQITTTMLSKKSSNKRRSHRFLSWSPRLCYRFLLCNCSTWIRYLGQWQ